MQTAVDQDGAKGEYQNALSEMLYALQDIDRLLYASSDAVY